MGKMKLVKVDISDKNKKLAGAKFKIEDLNGKIVGELVTNEEGSNIKRLTNRKLYLSGSRSAKRL